LEELIQQKNLTLGFPLQWRVKPWESIAEKIQRKALEIKKIIEVKDLIGIRITFLFQRDALTACELVRQNFKILEEENTLKRLGDSQFGYSSIHFLAELKADWLSLPTFKRLGNFRAEIQVRTVAQHIWAAASHVLQYKHEASVPPPIRRAIFRVAALLEMADLEFERVLSERASYVTHIETASSSEVLNVDLLAKILDEELPLKNKSADSDDPEDYAELLGELLAFSIDTPDKLRALLKKQEKATMKDEIREVKRCEKQLQLGRVPHGTSVERTQRGVYFTHVGLTRGALQKEVGEKKYDEFRQSRYLELLQSRKVRSGTTNEEKT